MQYTINTKNIKQSVQNVVSFLKEKNISIPRNVVLELFAKALFYKNWNTLKGLTDSPKIISHLKNTKCYMIEIECKSLTKSQLISLFKETLITAKCNADIINLIENNGYFHFELHVNGMAQNILTTLIILSHELKTHTISHFEMCTIHVEKQNLMLLSDAWVHTKQSK